MKHITDFSRLRLLTLLLVLCATAGRGADPPSQASSATPPAPSTRLVDTPALGYANKGLPSWLTLSGEFRYRFESRQGLGYVEGNDDAYSLLRTRLNLGIQATPWLQFFVQGQDSRAPGIRESASNNGVFRDPLDLRQAYVKIGATENSPVTVTVGRELLSYGPQRLIGPLDWTNTARTFDAAKLEVKPHKNVKLDFFSASVVQNDPNRRIDLSPEGTNLHGFYGAVQNVIPKSTIEPYVLWRTSPLVQGEGLRGDLDRYTAGFRLWSPDIQGWDYDVSFNRQWGSFGSGDIEAWAYYLTLGRKFNAPTKPRAFVEYNFASGDDDPTDGNIGWFDDVYPTAHLWYGYNDLVGWRNIKNLRLGYQFEALPKLRLNVDFHFFWLADPNDNLYNVAGAVTVRPPAGGAEDTKVGDELDITFAVPLTATTTVGAGVGHMFPGPLLKANTPGGADTFVYLFLGYKF